MIPGKYPKYRKIYKNIKYKFPVGLYTFLGGICAHLDEICALLGELCVFLCEICALLGEICVFLYEICALLGEICAFDMGGNCYSPNMRMHDRVLT